MKLLLMILLWSLLFAVCWPLALLVLIVFPILWLIALPFRLALALVEGVLALIRAVIFLPARILGWRPRGV
jgi:hypothetical protein